MTTNQFRPIRYDGQAQQVFQLCLAALLVGMDLAVQASLQERLTTNNERYQKICELLKSPRGTASERLLGLVPTVQALERYQFVAEGVDNGPRLAAARLASAMLGECDQGLPESVTNALRACGDGKREDGEIEQLAAIEALDSEFGRLGFELLTAEMRVVREIVHMVWMSLFQRYYWLKGRGAGK